MTKRMFMGGFLAAVLTGMAATAHAGDIANIQPVGFSADGKVFAFQEFGMKDGKVPYSDTYFIDTDTGADLEGTPRQLPHAVRLEKVGRHEVGDSTGPTDGVDGRFPAFHAATADDYVGAPCGKLVGGGAADPAGGAGDQGGLAGEVGAHL